jgi:Jacalin-like lectin domain
MVDVPNSSTALGHISSINCFYNDLSTKPQIQLLQVLYTGSWKSYPAAYHHVTKNISMNFAANEHLIQVTMTRDNSIFAISSINFKTSLSKEYFIGSAVGEKMTFTAPLKWRIVGFHGTAGSSVNDSSVSGSYRYPITKLGVVYAPIPV